MAVVRDRDLDQQVSEDWIEIDRQSWHHIDPAAMAEDRCPDSEPRP